MSSKRRFLGLMGLPIASMALPFLSKIAVAQNYPTRPVRIIVPWPAGGNGDALGRALAQELTKRLGQSFIVENLSGAGGSLGIQSAAAAPHDGYTIVQVTAAATINATLYPNLKFDLTKDFKPIGNAATLPLILVVHPSVPASNVQEFVAYAKANPGKLNYCSAGTGTGGHVAAELFKVKTGIDATHIPYKGAAFAMNDLIAGRTQFYFDGIPSAMTHVRSGRLKLLGITSTERFEGLPDVPTLVESGIPVDASVWFGFMMGKGTDDAIVNLLNKEMNEILGTPAMRQQLVKMGFQPVPLTTPAQFGDYIKTEIDRWAEVIKASGAKAD